MGSWVVLKYWNQWGDDLHDWHMDEAHTLWHVMEQYKCSPVVEQHQDVEPSNDVPEFEIEIRFIATPDGRIGRKPGWKFTVAWLDEKGQRNFEYGYGYQHKEAAKEAAEHRARGLALAMLPTERYSYTPEF